MMFIRSLFSLIKCRVLLSFNAMGLQYCKTLSVRRKYKTWSKSVKIWWTKQIYGITVQYFLQQHMWLDIQTPLWAELHFVLSSAVLALRVDCSMNEDRPLTSVFQCPQHMLQCQSKPCLDIIQPSHVWSSFLACSWRCFLHDLFFPGSCLISSCCGHK